MNSRMGLILLLACLVAAGFGYRCGVRAEGARGAATAANLKTALAEAHALYAATERARAEAVAEAERKARRQLEEESARAAALASELAETQTRLAAERRTFNRRIALVSENARTSCAGLPADWVRLYNEALGLVVPGTASSAFAGGTSAGTAAASASTVASASGVRPDAGFHPDALTGPEDLIAHARDYGGYCRSLRAQLEAVLAFEGGRP